MNIIILQVLRGLYWLLQIASWAIVLRAILSWFMRPDVPVYSFLLRITEPLIAPFRPLAYKLTNGRLPIDLAPMFAYLVLIVLMNLLSRCMMLVY